MNIVHALVMVGTELSHFRIEEELGRGGMGVVYRATDLRLKRPVAVKILSSVLADDDTARERFLREARAAASLQHPNIGTIFETGVSDEGIPFIAMALYNGETLDKLIEKGLDVDRSVDLMTQIARGLQSAHEAGIIHRDIKPENILVTESGEARILDFGLAKLAGPALTKTGISLGTLAYASPEQVQGATIDERTDLWSLGAVAYEMLTGTSPFLAEYEQATMYRTLSQEPAPLPDSIPSDIRDLIGRLLEKKPENRPSSASEVLQKLPDTKHSRERASAGSVKNGRFRVAVTAGLVGVAALAAAYLLLSLPGRDVSRDVDVADNAPRRERVLVMPFEDRTGKDDLSAVGMMAADHVTSELSILQDIELVPAVTALMSFRNVDASYGAEGVVQMSADTRAGTIITGAIYTSGDSLVITAAINEIGGDVVSKPLTPIVVATQNPLAGVKLISNALVVLVAAHLDARGADGLDLKAKLPGYEAYRTFIDARDRYVALDFGGALESASEAIRLDSSFIAPLQLRAFVLMNIERYSGAARDIDRLERLRSKMGPLDRAVLDYMHGTMSRDDRKAREAALLA
ncbi:MAG: serine/threonine-protein kinase, partial [Rhodothermia bacterium]